MDYTLNRFNWTDQLYWMSELTRLSSVVQSSTCWQGTLLMRLERELGSLRIRATVLFSSDPLLLTYTTCLLLAIPLTGVTSFSTGSGFTCWIDNAIVVLLIAAKRWGDRLHTLLYMGPQVKQLFRERGSKTTLQINTSLHYMIPGSRNFVGLEVNKERTGEQLSIIARPQLRVSVTDNLLIGIVTGIPVDKRAERLSSFLRLIYEPGHRSRSSPD